MATVNKLIRNTPNAGAQIFTNVGGVGLANGDQSQPFFLGATVTQKSWQVTGTFGVAGSIQLEQSNDQVNWVIVGVAVVAAGFATLANSQTAAQWGRFNVTAGDGTTSMFVTLVALPQRGS